MNIKKLAKVIKLVVEQELKRQLPPLVKAGVLHELKEQKKINKPVIKENIEIVETDPFSLANNILDAERNNESVEIKDTVSYCKNPVLNEILNNTKRFRDSPGGINMPPEAYASMNESYTPPGETEPVEETETTLTFNSSGAQVGMEGMKLQMAAKMGHGEIVNPELPKRPGMNISTGLASLDRILNRDNRELVKKFKTR